AIERQVCPLLKAFVIVGRAGSPAERRRSRGSFFLPRLRVRRWGTGKLPLFTRSHTDILRPLWFAADLPARFESGYRRCHNCDARFSRPFRPYARNLARAQTREAHAETNTRPRAVDQRGATKLK